MTKFYICNSEIAKGPYRLHQIEELNILPADIIWDHEYGEKRYAMQVPEFRHYFKNKIKPDTGRKSFPVKKAEKIGLLLVLVVLLCMVTYYFTMM